MHIRSAAVVGVVVAVLVSLLSGCSLLEDDPQEKLEKIVAAIGKDAAVVSLEVVVNEKDVKNKKAGVSVLWVRDGQLARTSVVDGKVIAENPGSFSWAAPSTSFDKFSLDALIDKAYALVEPEKCHIASVTSVLSPAGSIGTWAECTGEGDGQPHVVDERSLLDGESFFVPRIDPQVANDLDVLKQAYTTVMGTSKIHRLSYYFGNAWFTLDGPVTTNALGESCVPTMTASFSSSSTPFPVLCDTQTTVGNNPFDLNEFPSTSIAEVVASVENSQLLDSRSLGSITFYHHNNDLCWKTTTTSFNDLANHRNLLEGCTTKGA